MEPAPIDNSHAWPLEDQAALRCAKQALEHLPLSMKLTSLLGAPVEKAFARLPGFTHDKIVGATRLALRKCLDIAFRTLGSSHSGGEDGVVHSKPHNRLHKLAVGVTGAAGGAFGLVALPIELPVTTTLMFRSIGEVARCAGEDLTKAEVQLECLAVLGMGGFATRQEQEADFGYFVLRGALAQAISKASAEIASKGLATHSSAAMLRLLQAVAARFSVQVTEQIAAKSLPALGAVLGATVNTLFIEHFQQIAQGHFAIRRLERKYGAAVVEAAYRALAA